LFWRWSYVQSVDQQPGDDSLGTIADQRTPVRISNDRL
jgi:hypothetical protein